MTTIHCNMWYFYLNFLTSSSSLLQFEHRHWVTQCSHKRRLWEPNRCWGEGQVALTFSTDDAAGGQRPLPYNQGSAVLWEDWRNNLNKLKPCNFPFLSPDIRNTLSDWATSSKWYWSLHIYVFLYQRLQILREDWWRPRSLASSQAPFPWELTWELHSARSHSTGSEEWWFTTERARVCFSQRRVRQFMPASQF